MLNEYKRIYGKARDISPEALSEAFAAIDWIGVAVLFGSRARAGQVPVNSRSDYDFAVSMDKNVPAPWGHIARARLEISQGLQLADCDFDLVDLQVAPAEIKVSIKEGYLLLKGSEHELRTLLG